MTTANIFTISFGLAVEIPVRMFSREKRPRYKSPDRLKVANCYPVMLGGFVIRGSTLDLICLTGDTMWLSNDITFCSVFLSISCPKLTESVYD